MKRSSSETAQSIRLTVAILTLNEEKRIATCIRSASFADQIIVADSGSKDRTREIAQSLGAEVHLYPDWEGFAVQRNRLLSHAKGEYIFFLDADEEFTPELVEEVRAAVHSGRDQIWRSCGIRLRSEGHSRECEPPAVCSDSSGVNRFVVSRVWYMKPQN